MNSFEIKRVIRTKESDKSADHAQDLSAILSLISNDRFGLISNRELIYFTPKNYDILKSTIERASLNDLATENYRINLTAALNSCATRFGHLDFLNAELSGVEFAGVICDMGIKYPPSSLVYSQINFVKSITVSVRSNFSRTFKISSEGEINFSKSCDEVFVSTFLSYLKDYGHEW